jgi:hypothetical protein
MNPQATLASACFAQTYAEARSKFLDAVQATGLAVASHAHPLPGHDGEPLALDVVRDGPADAAALLIISSACHGVEGFCGSGVQVALLRKRLDTYGIPYMANESHIVPVMVGDAKKCKWISDILMAQHGIYIQPINYPTVPRGTERLRITPTPLHTDADIDHLVTALSELWSQCALARAVA